MIGQKKSRKKIGINKNKGVLGVIIAAFISALAVFIIMLQFEKRELQKYEKANIYIASSYIPKGTRIDEKSADKYMEIVQLDKSCVPESAIVSFDDISDMVSGYSIGKGTLLTKEMFETMNEILLEIDDPVEVGLKAEDLYQIVGGVLRSGDRIDIYFCDEEGQFECGWTNVYVLNAFDSSGALIEPGDMVTATNRINVYLPKSEVATLYSRLVPSDIRVVKRCE